MPVGTAQVIQDRLSVAVPGVTLLWNPEFLREGFAVKDTLIPDRFVYGLPDAPGAQEAKALLDEVYATPRATGIPLVVTDFPTAELVKVSANSFLATDPQALPNARATHPQLEYAATAAEAVAGADIVLLLTEWADYLTLDPVALGKLVGQRIIIDGRNCLDPATWRAAGWKYQGIGRR